METKIAKFNHHILGRPVKDPLHHDYLPSKFSFIQGDK